PYSMAQCFNILDQCFGDGFSLTIIADKDLHYWLPFLYASSQIFPRKFHLSEGIGPTHHFSYFSTGIKIPNDAIHGARDAPHSIGMTSAEPIRSVHEQVCSKRRDKWQRKKTSALQGEPRILDSLIFLFPILAWVFVFETLFHNGS